MTAAEDQPCEHHTSCAVFLGPRAYTTSVELLRVTGSARELLAAVLDLPPVAIEPGLLLFSDGPGTPGQAQVALWEAAIASGRVLEYCIRCTPLTHPDSQDRWVMVAVVGYAGTWHVVLSDPPDQRHRIDHLERENAELAAQARRDPLTGLANRREWDRVLLERVQTMCSGTQALTVAMIDLDFFKRFNDTHGHLAGDEFLREAAASWSSHLVDGDLLARLGGEEFGLLAVGRPTHTVQKLVRRLCLDLPRQQTASAGVAGWVDGDDASSVMARADAALYAAKAAGRGQVRLRRTQDADISCLSAGS
jgi:diguanylate cyclase (GGDEF)-like protein